MPTIDKLDKGVYDLYAMRTAMLEQINAEFNLEQAQSIPPQTLVMDLYPRLSELDILLGIVAMGTPWAYYYPPKKLKFLRRSPFTYRVAPSLGSYEDQDKALALLESFVPSTKDEENEKASLQKLFKQLEQINDWLSFISGRVGQFLQG